MKFFPDGSLDDRPDLHAFLASWYVDYLVAMRENPLYPPSDDPRTVYRLLFLPTFQQPSVVRFTEATGNWRVVCKRSDGEGGYHPGQLIGTVERNLTHAEGQQLRLLLEQVSFWDTPSFVNSHGCDGARAVLEGVQAGRYHVVDRWSPHGTPYAELVGFLLELCRGVGETPPKSP
jgi:hypothetical protein